jgi:hypothetical protein
VVVRQRIPVYQAFSLSSMRPCPPSA